MRPTLPRTLGIAAGLLLLGYPHAAPTQTCGDTPGMLLSGGIADSAINPPGQEDNQFFTSQGGFPNIFFVMDTSNSMMRMPPNGPASLGLPAAGTAGCGTAASEGGLASSTMLSAVLARTYHSPCGTTAQERLPYAAGNPALGGGVDYAQVPATVCPYYSQGSNALAYGPGYDPDFPGLFPRDQIFHSAATDTGTYDATANPTGNGWDFVQGYPSGVSAKGKSSPPDDIATFCAKQGTNSAVCTTCLTNRGWYYDGTILSGTVDGVANVQYPSLWYTGNYLNFYPPKFVVARKVVKDVVAAQTKIRMALAQFSPSGSSHYLLAKDFNPSCQAVFGGGNWESNRSTYINAVNALTWGGGAPLASTLFDVGRYYHTPTLPWFGASWEGASLPAPSSNWLSNGSANQLSVCWSCQSSSIIVLSDAKPTVGDGSTLPPGPSSTADANKGKYAGDYTTGVLAPADCPRCGDFSGTDDYKNNLARVAFYLHNYDLRGESAGACGGAGGTLDGQGMPGKQVLDVYTVGFATGGQADTTRILSNAANAGGGVFVAADSADQLRAGIFQIFTEINNRSTSFSVATVSTLQTTTGHSVIVPRFNPERTPHWPGHLFRFELYSEFVNPCTPNGVGDLDCDGACGSVFLMDKDGHFIAEDGNGNFVTTNNGLPPCSATPQCVQQGKACGTLTNVPANPWWDAYQALQSQTWKQRKVFTVTDTALPAGVLDGKDAMVQLSTSAASTLQSYLALGTNGPACATIAQQILTAGDPITAQIVQTSKLECAKTVIRFVLGADVINEVGRTAAQGWPPPPVNPSLPASLTNPPDQEQLLDRPFKLGDIYHSSPVEVVAPLPSDGVLCPNGLHNQCMESLWHTQVKSVGGVNQYDLYAKSTAYLNRRKIVLVGSNDGMLHAFNGGAWHPNQDDPVTKGVDESIAPFNGYYDRGEVSQPVELWAFIPPDLLPKLSFLLTGEHQIFVDGTAMVRDVWVDGVGNGGGLTPGPNADNLKSASEFHTVAVVGERRGGNRYFALDVTDATKLDTDPGGFTAPKFLWIYPQPSSKESLSFGETYTEFLPVPPPIGPVRVAQDAGAAAAGYPAATADSPTVIVPELAAANQSVPFLERWVTILPGGFDPQYQRGRGVHMVDVWTGKELFDFSWAPNLPSVGFYPDPRSALNYPVAATPAMVMWGRSARRHSLAFENDGYFDTATFGDTGGQLWMLRFNRPGTLDVATGKATNWAGGRIFQMGYPYYGSNYCAITSGLPFFFITANTALPGSHVFRVYAGTGDRFNLLDTNGGTCGPSNLRACTMRGCTVTEGTAANYVTAAGTGYEGDGLVGNACSSYWLSNTYSQDTVGTPATCGMTASANVTVSGCLYPTVTGGPTGFTKDVALRCTPDAGGDYGCVKTAATAATAPAAYGSQVSLTSSNYPWPYQQRNWFFSIKALEDAGQRTIFDTPAAAAAYDYARTWMYDYVWGVSPLYAWNFAQSWSGGWVYTYSAAGTTTNWAAGGPHLAIIDGASNAPTMLASDSSDGWAIFYDHGPTITTDNHTYNVSLLDERTASTSGLYGKILWNTIQPSLGEATSAVTGCATSKCTAAFRRLSYHYAADAVTGGPVFRDASGNLVRSIVGNTLVPAQGDQPTVFVNQQGQIAVGMTAVNPEKGASNLGMSGAMDPVMGLGAIEVSRSMEACRHAPAGPTDVAPPAAACK